MMPRPNHPTDAEYDNAKDSIPPDIGEDGWVSPLKRRLQVAIPPIHEPERYVLCSNGCGATHHEDCAHHPCKGGE